MRLVGTLSSCLPVSFHLVRPFRAPELQNGLQTGLEKEITILASKFGLSRIVFSYVKKLVYIYRPNGRFNEFNQRTYTANVTSSFSSKEF